MVSNLLDSWTWRYISFLPSGKTLIASFTQSSIVSKVFESSKKGSKVAKVIHCLSSKLGYNVVVSAATARISLWTWPDMIMLSLRGRACLGRVAITHSIPCPQLGTEWKSTASHIAFYYLQSCHSFFVKGTDGTGASRLLLMLLIRCRYYHYYYRRRGLTMGHKKMVVVIIERGIKSG